MQNLEAELDGLQRAKITKIDEIRDQGINVLLPAEATRDNLKTTLDGLKNDASRIRGEISEKTTRLTEIMNELRGPEATADAIESFLNSLPPPPSDDTSDDTSDD